MDLEQLLEALAVPCTEIGVDVVDAELLRGGAAGRSASVLRVTVERRGDPLDLDAVASVSALISEVLDEAPSLGPSGSYDLEVTSPGLERRLRRPQHFRAAIGSQVAVKARPGFDGDRRAEGRLEHADEERITLALASGTYEISYGEIEQAHTVFDWRAALSARSRREEEGVPGR